VRFTGCICIGDSSEGPQLARMHELVKAAKMDLRIEYGEYPGLSNSHTIAKMLDHVPTEFAALLPDDDFLVPGSLQKCSEFLEANHDYSAAHGKGVMINVEENRVYGAVTVSGSYNIHSLEQDSGLTRIKNHLADYSVTLFSVHRTSTWRDMYKDVPSIKDAAFADEILPTSHAVASGKIKGLDCLYLVRHVHSGRYQHLNFFDWITSPNWQNSYEMFLDSVTTELVRHENIENEAARDAVKEGLWDYLSKVMHRRWNARYPQKSWSIRSAAKGVAKSFPFVKSGWHQARSFFPGRENELSLQALLRKSSRFHADFMPIYEAVTQEPGSERPAGQSLLSSSK